MVFKMASFFPFKKIKNKNRHHQDHLKWLSVCLFVCFAEGKMLQIQNYQPGNSLKVGMPDLFFKGLHSINTSVNITDCCHCSLFQYSTYPKCSYRKSNKVEYKNKKTKTKH